MPCPCPIPCGLYMPFPCPILYPYYIPWLCYAPCQCQHAYCIVFFALSHILYPYYVGFMYHSPYSITINPQPLIRYLILSTKNQPLWASLFGLKPVFLAHCFLPCFSIMRQLHRQASTCLSALSFCAHCSLPQCRAYHARWFTFTSPQFYLHRLEIKHRLPRLLVKIKP